MTAPFSLSVTTWSDVEEARRLTRDLALVSGFSAPDAEAVTLAVSELASNLASYARDGCIAVRFAEGDGRTGVVIESSDAGPGIMDIERALIDGFSTGGGLGGGLPGTRRLMDEFEIASGPTGTRIRACKWLRTT
jgi:serine/threonine-protein kinase RsbT